MFRRDRASWREVLCVTCVTFTVAASGGVRAQAPVAGPSVATTTTASQDPQPGTDAADSAVEAYTGAAWQMERTKTDATEDHPVAEKAMGDALESLRQRCAAAPGKERVAQAIHGRIERYHRAAQVAPPGEIEKARFQEQAATALLALLGLPAGPDRRSFPSTAVAVERITELLKAEDWKTLSTYYDLEGTRVNRAELESGKFFLNAVRPESAHPGLPWKYRHPFTPGFHLDREEPAATPDVVTVHLKVEIDQGGGMIQRGASSFRMRRGASGYQILPD